eukprot:CAMPEP_0185035692 /NCGR_PEP_ID=MMETSP1103-20130426/27546_1 /TAXON_ID=36769 /ORGANISM="Paraphysomonas bandaiensis, Strain Caron Lab Isolate" /LENGTH=477 /DNA_ID=CAMNT_0027572907 /DNA_START=299 /DNA_END=1735 /DNA_ORIENTATION=-
MKQISSNNILSDIEKSLVEALQCRFNPLNDVNDGKPVDQNTLAYIDAMKEVYDKYPDSACVACMYAEALMNTAPWKLWNLDTGIPTPYAERARAVLSNALAFAPGHPGLNHFLIHLMEMSPEPYVALEACQKLRYECCPDAGHLIHMPSHIYVLLGMYDDAADCNIEAIAVDNKYVAKEGIFNYYTGYRIHNMHFVAYAAMFAGQFEKAMSACRDIQGTLPENLLSDPVLATYFESFYSLNMHVLVRFGRWQEILDYELPGNTEIYPYTIAICHYSRGIANSVQGNISAALKEEELFNESRKKVPSERVLHNNLCSDMLAVGAAMLRGEILYRQGQHEAAYESLQSACILSDNLVYDEPWGWMQPPSHALGALLLEQGHVDRAELQYRRDMDTSFYGRCHPDNIWALRGLHSCLIQKMSQETSAEAKQLLKTEIDAISVKLSKIQTKSDVDISVSCMCAVGIPERNHVGGGCCRNST